MAFWNRRKSLESVSARQSHSALRPTLGWLHLMSLGIGGIVGTGIYTLIGVGAGLAGPAVILSVRRRRPGLRMRGAGVHRDVDDDAHGRQRLHLQLRGAGRIAGVVRWLDTDPRIYGRVQRRRGRLVRLRGRLHSRAGHRHSDALLAGPAAGGVINLPAIAIALAVAVIVGTGLA